ILHAGLQAISTRSRRDVDYPGLRLTVLGTEGPGKELDLVHTHDVQIENAPTAVDRVRHGHPVHHEKNLTTSAAADVDIGHTLVANLDLRSVVEGQNLRCLVDDRACLNGEYVGCRIETGERLHRLS